MEHTVFYIIVNPIAGAGKTETAIPLIERVMRREDKPYALIRTEKPYDIDRITSMIDFSHADAIICAGGDGTIQEYASLAVGRDIKYGVIPTGSANDLLYSIPGARVKFRSFEEKITYYTQRIIDGAIAPIDAISLNGERYFLNIAGTGIDAQVVHDALPMKKYFGSAAYFISLAKNAVTYKTEEMVIYVDGVRESDEFLLLAVSNGSYYGGNLRVSPPAVVDDGKITLCIVRKMPKLKLAALFPAVKPGWHTGFKEVSYVNCDNVTIEYTGKKTINIDGNLCELESPLFFEIKKGAVKFIV